MGFHVSLGECHTLDPQTLNPKPLNPNLAPQTGFRFRAPRGASASLRPAEVCASRAHRVLGGGRIRHIGSRNQVNI